MLLGRPSRLLVYRCRSAVLPSRKLKKKRGGGGMAYSLAERSALADGDLVTLLNTEGGRDVRRHVLVSLLVTVYVGEVRNKG